MNKDKKSSKTETSSLRQEAVAVEHRDLSTTEIKSRISQANTLISIYEASNARCQRIIGVAAEEQQQNNAMIGELRADIKTFDELVKTRQR